MSAGFRIRPLEEQAVFGGRKPADYSHRPRRAPPTQVGYFPAAFSRAFRAFFSAFFSPSFVGAGPASFPVPPSSRRAAAARRSPPPPARISLCRRGSRWPRSGSALAEIERLLCAAAGVTIDADALAAAHPRLGAVSFLHRFASALNRHVHLHVCVTDGGFTSTADGPACVVPPARPMIYG